MYVAQMLIMLLIVILVLCAIIGIFLIIGNICINSSRYKRKLTPTFKLYKIGVVLLIIMFATLILYIIVAVITYYVTRYF